MRKIASWAHEIDTLELVLILGEDAPEGCVALGAAMAAASPEFADALATQPQSALTPLHLWNNRQCKGAVHVHNAVVYHAGPYSGARRSHSRRG